MPSDMLAVEICFICDKVFYSEEDLDNHKQSKFHCQICKVCVTGGSSEIDYCSAMEHAEKLKARGFLDSFCEINNGIGNGYSSCVF